MANQYALVNKDVLALLRKKTHVSFDYLERMTGKPRDILISWEDTGRPERPTINPAKTLAKSYRVPFACLYMNPGDVAVCTLPNLKNMRTLPNFTTQDDSRLKEALNKYVHTIHRCIFRPDCVEIS